MIRQRMDRPRSAGSGVGDVLAKTRESEPSDETDESVVRVDFGKNTLGKPVGAVVAAVIVLRTLHASERPLKPRASSAMTRRPAVIR